MIKQLCLALLAILCLNCSAPPQRNCKDFKTGEFSFTSVIDGEKKQTTFSRTEEIEIDYFEGKKDTSSIRWINDCEYVLKNINPKSKAEEKSIHIKILTTSDSSYTFEYNAIGDKRRFKGTAFKTN
ncbi:DNA topoisomerase IV [Flagellimonas maritima]|nr:DNA topoisomerase IV [Allomuricauda aurantiaca]